MIFRKSDALFHNRDALKGLFRQVLKCHSISEFEDILNRV